MKIFKSWKAFIAFASSIIIVDTIAPFTICNIFLGSLIFGPILVLLGACIIGLACVVYTIWASEKGKSLVAIPILGAIFAIAALIEWIVSGTLEYFLWDSLDVFIKMVVLIALCVAFFVIKENADKPTVKTVKENKEKPVKVEQANTTVSNRDSISLLKEYKTLLDSGIISQEEFDQKKAQLFGK